MVIKIELTMIKYKQLPDNILKLIPKAVGYLQSHPNIIFSYLFGSLSKGKPSPLSDVDIAVFLKKEETNQEEHRLLSMKLL